MATGTVQLWTPVSAVKSEDGLAASLLASGKHLPSADDQKDGILLQRLKLPWHTSGDSYQRQEKPHPGTRAVFPCVWSESVSSYTVPSSLGVEEVRQGLAV